MSTPRTPSSLKWLITKRARLLGEIQSLQKQRLKEIAQCNEMISTALSAYELAVDQLKRIEHRSEHELKLAEADIRAIDTALSMHEIQIDPNIIPAIRTQYAARHLKYGAMTRGIYLVLKESAGVPVGAIDVALQLKNEWDLKLSEAEFQDFRNRIRHRMKDLCGKGKLIRIHQTKTQEEGLWLLPESERGLHED